MWNKNLTKGLIGLLLSGSLMAFAAGRSAFERDWDPSGLDTSAVSIASTFAGSHTRAWVVIDATTLENPRLRIWVEVVEPASHDGVVELAMPEHLSDQLDECKGHESSSVVAFDALQASHRESTSEFAEPTERAPGAEQDARSDSAPHKLYELSMESGERNKRDESQDDDATTAAPTTASQKEAYLVARFACDIDANVWTAFATPNYLLQLPRATLAADEGSTVSLSSLAITRTDSGMVYESGYQEPLRVTEADLKWFGAQTGNYYEWREFRYSRDGVTSMPDMLTARLLDIDAERRANYRLFVNGVLLGLAGALAVGAGSKLFDVAWVQVRRRSGREPSVNKPSSGDTENDPT